MKISFAVAVLLNNTSAVKINNTLQTQNVELPINGEDVAGAIIGGLEYLGDKLSDEMYQEETYCWNDYNPETGSYDLEMCETYGWGLRDDLHDAQRDLARAGEEFGVDIPNPLWDPKFLTDLVEAEYADFVN